MDFAHLHVHTEYSLLDGSIRISKLVKQVKSWGHKSVAVTDHGNLFGAVEFYTKAKAEGIKAIIGCEIFQEGQDTTFEVAKELEISGPPLGAFHLTLLAKNNDGYKRLIKLVSLAYIENLKDVPVAELRHLQPAIHPEGANQIFALSSCARGEFGFLVRLLRSATKERELPLGPFADSTANNVAKNIYEALAKHVKFMHEAFGEGQYYVELIDNNLADQKQLLPDLVTAARHFGLPLVASADAHYLDAKSVESHAVLMGIKHDLKLTQIRQRNRSARFHLLNNDEFKEVYKLWPEAISNTLAIADACNVKFEFGKYFLPQFPTPSGETAADTLRRLAHEGLNGRFTKLDKLYGSKFNTAAKDSYRVRLDFELDVINNMGFPGYFLIVQDFINWAKEQGIPVGPGRGSGVGSLVAYALRITDLDPIPYNLAFERFLNPERVSMPDFDVDFCQDRRDEVIKYVARRYGDENVAQITTFGKALAKAAIRDVGRVMNVSYGKVDRISKMVPAKLPDGGVVTLKDAMEAEPRLRQEAERDDTIAALLHMVEELEGLSRHTSVHAAGIVMSDGPMINYVPVYTTTGDTGLITQYEMKNAEKVGLVKFDFLGLKTLTVIDRAAKLVQQRHNPKFDITEIPIDDKRVFEEISNAHTCGIFQLEGNGFQQLLVKLRPNCFEDIIAVVALYRPGPLGSGMTDDFIDRKHGRKPIEYPLPQLEPILKETYGIMLYQEQVMRVAATLASYSLGEADLLRRAMGKKIASEMAAQKSRFVDGCVRNGIKPEKASEIFDLMEKFAEYGFNKSHSAAYGLVTYQTAYLKAHYPEEFMAAIMTCDLDNTKKITRYLDECRRLRIEVKSVNINRSVLEFDVIKKGTIGYGMSAIKGLGAMAMEPVIKDRAAKGPFKTLTELARRVDLRKVGKKTLELLTTVGGMDGFGLTRNQLFPLLGELVKFSESLHAAKSSGQRGLFDDDEDSPISDAGAPEKIDDFPWERLRATNKKMPPTGLSWLKQEKKLLGAYLTGHPLHFMKEDLRLFSRGQLSDIPNLVGRGSVSIVALLVAVHERITKSGSRIASIRLEDPSGSFECVMFERDLPEQFPVPGTAVVAVGTIDEGFNKGPIRFKLERIIPLLKIRSDQITGATLRVKPIGLSSKEAPPKTLHDSLLKLHGVVAKAKGAVPFRLILEHPRADVLVSAPHTAIEITDDCLEDFITAENFDTRIEYQVRPSAPAQ